MVKATMHLEDGRSVTFERETMFEAIRHAEEAFYPIAIRMDFVDLDKKKGGDSPG